MNSDDAQNPYELTDVPDNVEPYDHFPKLLTAREVEILHWSAAGKTNAEQAIILDISANTVGFHLKNIYRKLGVSNRAGAVKEATDKGMIFPQVTGRKQQLRDIYSGFVEGNAEPLLGLLDPEVEWICTAPRSLFPHAGRANGLPEVISQLEVLYGTYICRRFLPRIFIEEENQIAVYLDVDLEHRETGNRMYFEVSHFWTFSGAHAVRYIEIFNSAAAYDQFVGTESDD